MQDAEGISLLRKVAAMVRGNVKFVERALTGAGHKRLPDSGAATGMQRVGVRIPSIKAAYHRDGLRIGSPHAEACALLACN